MFLHMIAEIFDAFRNVRALVTLELTVRHMRCNVLLALGLGLEHLETHGTRECFLLRVILLVPLERASVLEFFLAMLTLMRTIQFLWCGLA